jgi:hypothetical protein
MLPQAGRPVFAPNLRAHVAGTARWLTAGDAAVERALLELLREEVNVKQLELIGDDSTLS